MHSLQHLSPSSHACLNIVDHIDDLARITEPDCEAIIWQREESSTIQSWLDSLTEDQLPRRRTFIEPQDIRETMLDICESSGTPHCRERDALIDDIVLLSEKFVKLMAAPYLRLRVDVVTTNACKKFHVDYLKARLVCTYRGTGTQYGLSVNGDDPHLISFVPTGSPLLMKGKHWEPTPPTNLLHRSPQIQGTGETRLVLVLDPVYELPEDNTEI